MLALPPVPAAAHAVLQSSKPPAGAELERAPDAVVLEFTEEPDAALSSFRVRNTESGLFEKAPTVRGRTVTVPLRSIPRGIYLVEWRVVSRVDGHLTAGAFAFGVGEAPGEVTAPPPAGAKIPPLGVSGRFLLLVGLSLILGTAWVTAFAFREAPRGTDRLMVASILLAVAGLVMLAESQRQSASVGYSELLSTFLGRALIFRAAGIAASALAIALAMKLRSRIGFFTSALFSAVAILAHVVAGHAGAVESLRWLKIVSQWAHFSAAGVWVGGLAALLIGLRGAATEEKAHAVRRYSFAAGIALAFVVLTGTFRAINGVGSWKALFETGYGRLVILKVALIVGLIALGALNRYRNVPRAGHCLTGLRRVSRIEILLAVIVLAATALLANLSPPTTAATAAPAGISTSGSDFAETTRVHLEVAPGDPGVNLFTLKVENFDSLRPVNARRVVLRFDFPADPDVPETSLELRRAGAGVFRSRGPNLSVDGPWRLSALVQQRDDSFEIPLEFSTRCRAEGVRVGGQPTLYDVRLPEGRSAQGYVDPGKSGANEVHFTFFDAGGLELPTGMTTTILSSKRGGGIVSLNFTKLSAGHFVARANLQPGISRFDITSLDSAGVPVRACFEERIST